MNERGRAALLGMLVVASAGCGGDPASDAGASDAALYCGSNAECDDGLFCNGAERCAPGMPGADLRGCVFDARPCAADDRCDEEADACLSPCDRARDGDGDGHDAIGCGGDDCDDADADRFPGNVEVCDEAGHDEDCDATTYGALDVDGDGFASSACCNADADGALRCGDDCSDARRDVRPGNTEACDRVDNDCDGATDEGVTVMGYVDADFDLHGASGAAPTAVCADAPGFSTVADDCDDENPAAHAAQAEICDGLDNDCDAAVDEDEVPATWYRDDDADGFGSADSGTLVSCSPPLGYSLLGSDCDDGARSLSPAARELCNGRDDDCNGRADMQIDADDFEDDDGDGYPDRRCGGNDCDDTDASTHPGAIEACDGVDNDCDGVVDGADASAEWYLDDDGDGFGDEVRAPISACEPQPGRVPRGGDCDDTSAAVRPGVADPCDGVDQDCDGTIDESGIRFAFYPDADGDGWGTTSTAARVFACVAPAGTVRTTGDCADTDEARYPTAPETCDDVDEDCDGVVDEDAATTWYADSDRDGHGRADPSMTVVVCDPPPGYAPIGDDCDDEDARRAPSHADRCDGIDNDCDSGVDEGADAACAVPGATAACVAGECTITACSGAFEDCDGDRDTGCEVDLNTNVGHCGACYAPCAVADTCGREGTVGVCDHSPLTRIEAGEYDMMGQREAGTSFGWGQNEDGMLGDGTALRRGVPVSSALPLFVDVAVGAFASCGLTSAGRVYCWGENTYGQLGNGTTGPASYLGGYVTGLDDVVHLSAGSWHACAIRAGGEVWCWGRNNGGVLGNVALGITNVSSGTPVRVDATPVDDPLDDAVELHAADEFTCVRRPASGGGFRVSCWGHNDLGQLGRGVVGVVPHEVADVLSLPTDLVELANGLGEHTCARTSGGQIYCWGAGRYGKLGNAAIDTNQPTPTLVDSIGDAVAVAIGFNSSCALRAVSGGGATVWCWGYNEDGLVGVGNETGAFGTPQAVVGGITDAIDVAVGQNTACVLRRGSARPEGEVWCWGDDRQGERGDGGDFGVATGTPVRAVGLP